MDSWTLPCGRDIFVAAQNMSVQPNLIAYTGASSLTFALVSAEDVDSLLADESATALRTTPLERMQDTDENTFAQRRVRATHLSKIFFAACVAPPNADGHVSIPEGTQDAAVEAKAQSER